MQIPLNYTANYIIDPSQWSFATVVFWIYHKSLKAEPLLDGVLVFGAEGNKVRKFSASGYATRLEQKTNLPPQVRKLFISLICSPPRFLKEVKDIKKTWNLRVYIV